MEKNQSDLCLEAHQAAHGTVSENALEADEMAQAAFRKAGNDPADWTRFKNYFNAARAQFTALSKAKAFSKKAEKKA